MCITYGVVQSCRPQTSLDCLSRQSQPMPFSLLFFCYRCVKLLIIRHPTIEVDLYQLAATVNINLERVHPSGKLLRGVCSGFSTFYSHLFPLQMRCWKMGRKWHFFQNSSMHKKGWYINIKSLFWCISAIKEKSYLRRLPSKHLNSLQFTWISILHYRID